MRSLAATVGRNEEGESFRSLVPLGLMTFPTIGREAITSAIDEEEGECGDVADGRERCLNLPKNMRGEEEDEGVERGGDSGSLFIFDDGASHDTLERLRMNLCMKDIGAKLARELKFRDNTTIPGTKISARDRVSRVIGRLDVHDVERDV